MWVRLFARPPSSRGPRFNGQYRGYTEDARQFYTTNRGYPPRPYEQNRGYNPRQIEPPSRGYSGPNSGSQAPPQQQQPPQQPPQPFRPRFIQQGPRQQGYRPHEPREPPPQPAYHADPSEDVDPHPAAYYADQDTGEGHAYENENVYVNRAFGKRAYPCKACNKMFLTTSHLEWHVNEAHYAAAAVFHTDIAVTSYATVQASIGKLDAEPQTVCLDSGATHTLINSSLIIDHPLLVGETL